MNPDLSPYAGRWVALANEQVAGIGHSPDEALHMGRRSQPKARLVLQFVDAADGEQLLLPKLLGELRPYLMQTGQPIYLVGGAVRDALLADVIDEGVLQERMVVSVVEAPGAGEEVEMGASGRVVEIRAFRA